jgi:ABC-type polar amino acid transport system ATPase subunit
MRFARHVGDRMIFMNEGSIVEEASPEDMLNQPREQRTQQFLNSILRTEKARLKS